MGTSRSGASPAEITPSGFGGKSSRRNSLPGRSKSSWGKERLPPSRSTLFSNVALRVSLSLFSSNRCPRLLQVEPIFVYTFKGLEYFVFATDVVLFVVYVGGSAIKAILTMVKRWRS